MSDLSLLEADSGARDIVAQFICFCLPKIIYFYVYEYFACIYMSAYQAFVWGPRRALDPLEPELPTITSCHKDAGN